MTRVNVRTWHPMSGQLRRVGYAAITDTVSAGADQTGKLEGQTVTLTATASDGSAVWSQVGGPSVTVTTTGALTATFVAPPVSTATVLTFEAVNGFAADRMTVTVNPSSSGLRFPGDPGVGNILVGATNGSTSNPTFPGYDITWFDARIWPTLPAKKHKIVRDYSSLVVPTSMRNKLEAWIGEGRIPIFSMKSGTYTLAQIASGAADSAIDEQAAWFATLGGPMWVSFYHEPENFTSATDKANYRAAFRRMISRSKAVTGVNAKIAWTTMYSGWTFQAASGLDWRDWHPNWDGSAFSYDLLDMEGIDLYNPTVAPNITASSRNKTWRQSVDEFLTKIQSAGQMKPWCIGEYGVYTLPATLDDNGNTVAPLIESLADIGAVEQSLVGVTVWNASAMRYDDANDPGGVRVTAWRNLINNNSNVVTI